MIYTLHNHEKFWLGLAASIFSARTSFVHEYFRSLTIEGNRKSAVTGDAMEGANVVLTLRLKLVTDVIGETGKMLVWQSVVLYCVLCVRII
jgi:hypothetical protein